MSDNEHNPWNLRSKWLIELIVVLAGVLFIISTCTSIHRHTRMLYSVDEVKDFPYFTDMDNAVADTVDPVSDRELIGELWRNQRHIHNTQADLLADVRQETNNSLEKITSELNFWIAILAFLGVFVPIALTYKGEKDFKSRFEESNRNNKERLNTYIESVNHRISELTDGYSKKSGDFDRRKKEYEDLNSQLDLLIDSSTLSSIRNNRYLEDEAQIDAAYRHLAFNSIRKFIVNFDKAIEDGNVLKEKEKKWTLVRLSMLYYDMLRNLTLSHTGSTRPRYLDAAENAAKLLIQELVKDSPDIEQVRKCFGSVRSTYSSVKERMTSSV